MVEVTQSTRARNGFAVAIRRMTCVILALSGLGCGLFAQTPLSLQVSTETAPAGSFVQIKVYSVAPASVASGSIAIDLDPTVFGEIAGIAVFSANGDAMGYANVSGQHADAHFSSASNGIGLLPGLPVFTISVPVLANAAPGMTTSVTLDPSGSTWQDAQNNPYSVTVSLAQFSVGGSLSVGNVTPGGGVLPAGAILQISGTGFDAGTTASIDGVSVFDVQLVSPEVLQVILGAPTEMTGKHVQVVDSSGSQADYFCSLPSAPSNSQPPLTAFFAGTHFIVPLRAFATDQLGADPTFGREKAVALLNRNWSSVDVRFFGTNIGGFDPYDYVVTIPPGALYFIFSPHGFSLGLMASQPLRILNYQISEYTGVDLSSAVPQPPVIFVSQPNVCWYWPTGSPAPSPASVNVEGSTEDFTVSVTGAPWLSISPTRGTGPVTLTLTPNVSGLSQGIYRGTVTITPAIPGPLFPVTINVTLTVGPPVGTPVGTARTITKPRVSTAQPISVSPTNISWNWSPGMPAPISTISVGGTGSFVISFPVLPWLAITPNIVDIGPLMAPITFTLTLNVSALGPGVYNTTVIILPWPIQPPGPSPFISHGDTHGHRAFAFGSLNTDRDAIQLLPGLPRPGAVAVVECRLS